MTPAMVCTPVTAAMYTWASASTCRCSSKAESYGRHRPLIGPATRLSGPTGSFLPIGRLRFKSASAAKDAGQRVVAFMTSVLVQRFFSSEPRVLPRPQPIPCCRIFDRETVQDRLVAGAREPFDHLQVLARSAELRLVGEVGRLDDERVAFPSASGIAHPPFDVRGRMRAADTDDARVVNHLVEDHDGVARLHDLLQVVVEVIGKRGRSRRRAKTEQAPLGERARFGTVVLS